MFTQCRNRSDAKGLKLYGRNLEVKDRIKYLGVSLHIRPKSKFHWEIVVTKARGLFGRTERLRVVRGD